MAVCHLFAIPYTGCGLNPARSLGPAVASLSFDGDHFVYWAGPIVGAVLAASVYHIMYFRSVQVPRGPIQSIQFWLEKLLELYFRIVPVLRGPIQLVKSRL